MAQLYSEFIQLCQNCPADNGCIGTVVPGANTSEDCYNHLNADVSVKMVSFDPLGTCWAYTLNTCMEPGYYSRRGGYSSVNGTWSARRLTSATGKPA